MKQERLLIKPGRLIFRHLDCKLEDFQKIQRMISCMNLATAWKRIDIVLW